MRLCWRARVILWKLHLWALQILISVNCICEGYKLLFYVWKLMREYLMRTFSVLWVLFIFCCCFSPYYLFAALCWLGVWVNCRWSVCSVRSWSRPYRQLPDPTHFISLNFFFLGDQTFVAGHFVGSEALIECCYCFYSVFVWLLLLKYYSADRPETGVYECVPFRGRFGAQAMVGPMYTPHNTRITHKHFNIITPSFV